MSSGKNILLTKEKISLLLDKLSSELINSFTIKELNNAAFLGIQLKGVPLSERLAKKIKDTHDIIIPIGTLDITMHRDDFGLRKKLPNIRPTEVPFDLDDKIIILVDDVLHTGRTIRAALDAITDYGRPKLIRLAVLIDRGAQEFPIKADFTGETMKINPDDKIVVTWTETDNADEVYSLSSQSNKGKKQ
jgi:pyrimidine operon attenuation protein/uracil phosphoribosyltransferase